MKKKRRVLLSKNKIGEFLTITIVVEQERDELVYFLPLLMSRPLVLLNLRSGRIL